MSIAPDEVRRRVVGLVARVLGVSAAELEAEGEMGVTPKWDSLAQLNVLTMIEQEYGVTIEPEEAVDLTSIASLSAFLGARSRP